MDPGGVLIVGGGPAGSSCAWGLRKSGLDVTILDKARFPRDKVCGGWITPQVLKILEIDPVGYADGRTLQPIRGFRTGCIGGPSRLTRYPGPVSYGIRRCEFDTYLLRRSRARVVEEAPLETLERSGDLWIANGKYRARLVVGAGGHFCPVARILGLKQGREPVVAAREIEFFMDEGQRSGCAIRPEIPELYFCSDMKGYGWCFRKGDYLNVGLGRLDCQSLTGHVEEFVSFLRTAGRIPDGIRDAWPGHAYLLYGYSPRDPVGDGFMLIGDAAGLAYPQSGEGILPAVESGLIAAEVILRANGDFGRCRLQEYSERLAGRFGKAKSDWTRRAAALVPRPMVTLAARSFLAMPWFTRHFLLDRWFLHSQ